MATTDELLDQLMESCKKHENPNEFGGFLNQLFRTTLNQDLHAGMTEDRVSTKEEYP
jgi:hypothetical protein